MLGLGAVPVAVASGGSIARHDSTGYEAVGLAAGPHGGNVGISSEAGKLMAWLNISDSGAHLVTRDEEGNVTGRVP